MAIKRTKKHKLKQTEKQSRTYSLADLKIPATESKVTTSKSQPSLKKNDSQEMFGYSLDYIRQDLLKTFFVTLIVVSVLIGIVYFDMR